MNSLPMMKGGPHIFTRILITILLLLAKHQRNPGDDKMGEGEEGRGEGEGGGGEEGRGGGR